MGQQITGGQINGYLNSFYLTATGTGASQAITVPSGFQATDIEVYEDGVRQLAGTHYTLSGTTLTGTFTTGSTLIIQAKGGAKGEKGDTGPQGNMSGTNNLGELTNPTIARINLGLGNSAVLNTMTAPEFRSNTANRVIVTDTVWLAQTPVALSYTSSMIPDMSTFINATINLTGNLTLNNPINMKIGQSGFITLIQSGSSAGTLVMGDQYWFSGGVIPKLSTTLGAVDRLYYTVTSSTTIDCTLVKDVQRVYFYDDAAVAYFTAMTVQPDRTRKNLINDLIAGLRTDGAWTLLDNFFLLASHDSASSMINAANPSKVLTTYNSPVFTTDRGWQATATAGGVSTAQLYTSEAFIGTGLKRTSVSQGAFGVWENTTFNNSGNGIIGDKSNNNYDTIYMNGSTLYGRMGGATYMSYNYGTATKGMRSVARSGTGSMTLYKDGTSVATGTVGSSTQSAALGILSYGSNGQYNGTPNRQAFAFSGGDGFTSAMIANLYNRVNTYLTAIGAN